ncbi:saccharopine dehydrogenase NADP-binding domain-containing protein [Asticcacaulis sp. ZE23SCel15]|uniref:saccharopine dehydrogenase NADP-binding domain-containing protein n=1 Tax=Asticcacaulis sp. ZE23SCel15 TaxID=3059027 RepID=UPI0026603402|nr:saccharopine dehydrogenase NADP-binding domain-containing protein [Asticcacaulis sp. ZE23SCel15]WKL56440.1 saccharopine dehydrogenase NADP-binding domain-containing protein [Asticcacaulis sp. ZE23SCel15]
MGKVLILGGYGNFGKRIAEALIRSNVPVIIAGRDLSKAQALAHRLKAMVPDAEVGAAFINVDDGLIETLKNLSPKVVVNTVGPFQRQDYHVARACIAAGMHYIDLADGREFVTGITALDDQAKAENLCVISGASTVPGLSSAVVERYRSQFSVIESMMYGINPGQKAERGLATTKGILSYVGKKLKPGLGQGGVRYGWQDVYRQTYPELGTRWMANCDVPDLDLLPEAYGIKFIRFSAGLEHPLLHLGLWGLSWLVRIGVPLKLERHAALMLRMSDLFNGLGTADGGMHVILRGTDAAGQMREVRWFIIARNGDGPQIPCVPAIILARGLAQNDRTVADIGAGAKACVGLVNIDDYLAELQRFDMKMHHFEN